jgi:N-acetylglutamate synthase-like GNAT family acetyltransferase
MFITRATRHDRPDIQQFLEAHGWEADLTTGATFFARDGGVVGSIRLIEVEPRVVVVDTVVVDAGRRREGIGRALLQAAMNSRGGTLYLCCHDEHIAFYEKFGFAQVEGPELPDRVASYFRDVGDLPSTEDHRHLFMRAR